MWRALCFRCVGRNVIGWQAWNSAVGQGQPVRRFVRRQLSEPQHRSLRPVRDVECSSRGSTGLLRPLAFAVTVTGASYTIAAVWQYETFRRLAKPNQHRFSQDRNFYGKAGDFRHQLNAWWNSLYPTEKLVCGIIGVNAAVFVAWRFLPQFSVFMAKYFMASPMAQATCWPMLLCTFSHYNFFHLFVNMYVLWSFAPVASNKFGKEQFLATYVSAGVIASFASYVYNVVRGSMLPSLGASGAIMALIGIVGTSFPDTRLQIAFVSKIFPHSFSADSGVKGLIAFDMLGMVLGWRFLDHAGHLGGMLFGIWYAKYGHQIAKRYRERVVQHWHNLRGKP